MEARVNRFQNGNRQVIKIVDDILIRFWNTGG